jgi:hypothetical protein
MACNLLRKRPAEDAFLDGVQYIQQWTETMATEQSIPQTAAAMDRSRDLSKLYRKIGVSAVVAALEAIKLMRERKDFPPAVRDADTL